MGTFPDVHFTYPNPQDRRGESGSKGSIGGVGNLGETGDTGTLRVETITKEDFYLYLTKPRIVRIDPHDTEVGASITIHGANFSDGHRLSFRKSDSKASVFRPKYVTDTLLSLELPHTLAGRWEVHIVDEKHSEVSNPADLTIRPRILSVSPEVAVPGKTITIQGAGFVEGARALFRGFEWECHGVAGKGDTKEVSFEWPAPEGPYEEIGGQFHIQLRNPDGVTSAPFPVRVRSVLDTGFKNSKNGFRFANSPTRTVADLITMGQTFGQGEIAAIAISNPLGLAKANWLYSLYFASKPGYSSAFSMVAAYEFWSGNNDLAGTHQKLEEVDKRLTVVMGRLLSTELLNEMHSQALAGKKNVESTLKGVEALFRQIISAPEFDRVNLAPIVQTVPSGGILNDQFLSKISSSHGLLPIRIEYAVPGDSFIARMYLYENRLEASEKIDVWLEFRQLPGSTDMWVELLGYDTVPEYSSEQGWTLTFLPLSKAYFSDVSLPLTAALLAPLPF